MGNYYKRDGGHEKVMTKDDPNERRKKTYGKHPKDTPFSMIGITMGGTSAKNSLMPYGYSYGKCYRASRTHVKQRC